MRFVLLVCIQQTPANFNFSTFINYYPLIHNPEIGAEPSLSESDSHLTRSFAVKSLDEHSQISAMERKTMKFRYLINIIISAVGSMSSQEL